MQRRPGSNLARHGGLPSFPDCPGRLPALAIFVIAAALTAPAIAQIETVTVTAQKRTQNIMDVPITVDAFTTDQIKQSNINNLGELQTIAPSLFMDDTSGGAADTTFRIRGVGTTGNNTGLEGAVGVFIDGVYRNRGGLAIEDMVDTERVEVLEGPQSTLFGKNTSAGAINLINNAPTQDFGGEAEASVTNYDGYKLDGWLNVPVSDTLATRWSAVYDSRDGFIKDLDSHQPLNDRNRSYIRGQALWTPNSDVSLRIIADFGQLAEHCCGAINILDGPAANVLDVLAAQLGHPPLTPNRSSYVTELAGGLHDPIDSQDEGISAELNWQMSPDIKLTNIVADRDFMQSQAVAASFSGADILDVPLKTFKDKVFSDELRFSGDETYSSVIESLHWLTGAYYTNEDIVQNEILQDGSQTGNYYCALFTSGAFPACFTGNAAAGTLPIIPGPLFPFGTANFNLLKGGTGDFEHFFERDNSWSIFGSTTVNFTRQLSFTGGLRYGEDDKTGGGSFVNNNPAQAPGITPCDAHTFTFGSPPSTNCYFNFPFQIGTVLPYGGSVDDTSLTGNASLQYHWNDALMTYASYGRGFKAGGLNLDRTAAGIVSGNDGIPYYPPSAFNDAFKPEFSDNYEAGVKSRLFDNRVALSGTAFYTQFHNLQVLNFDGIDFHITNADFAYTKGFEEQGEAELFDGFTVSTAVTFADTAYGHDVVLPALGLFGPATPTAAACRANLVPDRIDCLGGRALTNAPRWSTSNGFTYSFPIMDLTATLHGDMFYGSSRNTSTDLDINKIQGGYTLFNAQFSLESAENGWKAALWCKNCTDKHYLTVAFDAPDQTPPNQRYDYDAFVGDPRIFGLTISKDF